MLNKNCALHSFCIVLAGIILASAAAGCGDAKIPDPPVEKNNLLVDIFRSMQGMRHDAATGRLSKLKTVYPNETSIDELKEIEYDNMFIRKIQKSVDNNDLKSAEQYLARAIEEQKLHMSLLKLRKELAYLKKIQDAVAAMQYPESANSLKTAIAQVESIIAEFPQAKSLSTLLDGEKKFAAEMDACETRRALFSLLSEYRSAKLSKQDEIAAIISAQLKVQGLDASDPYSAALLNDLK